MDRVQQELDRCRRIRLWRSWLTGYRQEAGTEPPKFAITHAVSLMDDLVTKARATEDTQTLEEEARLAGAKAAKEIA